MKELYVSRDADVDILEIWVYHCEKSEASADRISDNITEKYATLCEFPLMGRPRGDLGLNLRSFPVSDYNIIYKVSEVRVTIMRVLHGSRDLTQIFPETN